MTKTILTFVLASVCNLQLLAQTTTITLYPSKDAGLGYHDNYNTANTNFGNSPQLAAFAITGTQGGVLANRALFDFDFSTIPVGANIIEAKLNLYAFNASSNPQLQVGHFGTNASYLRRTAFQWDEYTVTWNNQPLADIQDQIVLPQSTSANQDYENIDVTALVQYMIDNPSESFGFKLSLVDEEIPTNLSFHSRDGNDSTKYPRLEITYENCREYNLVAYRDASLGYHDFEPTENENFGSAPHVSAFAIDATVASGLLANRAIIDFDLSPIAPNSTVDSAFISLYAYTGSPNPILQNGHFGANACYLTRVTEQWDEYSATWNNQAASIPQNQVTLAQSTSATEDYINIDVTALVQDMVNNPNASFGFKLQLIDEVKSKSLSFHSKDSNDPNKHPKLKVIVNCKTSGINEAAKPNLEFIIYPNPTSGSLNLAFPNHGERQINIYSTEGKLVHSLTTNEIVTNINLSELSRGLYFVRCEFEGYTFSKKLIFD